MIYLDHSATTPMRPEVRESMRPYYGEIFGNAGSLHRFGRTARAALEQAREQVAFFLNASPEEIAFTSGGTESNNLAVKGCVRSKANAPGALLISSIEHPSVIEPARQLANRGEANLHIISVTRDGRLDLESLRRLIKTRDVRLVSVMHANHETGVLQPIEEAARICHEFGALLHVDAVQSAGMIPVDVDRLGVDFLTLSAHKIYGPQGAGALYIRKGIPLQAELAGGTQQQGKRAGTENVAGIVGFGTACVLAGRDREAHAKHCRGLRDRLETALLESVPEAKVNGDRERRLPHVANIGFDGRNAEELIYELDAKGAAVSAGATCAHGESDASPVLLAMGLDHRAAQSALRFSLGPENTAEEIEQTVRWMLEIMGAMAGKA